MECVVIHCNTFISMLQVVTPFSLLPTPQVISSLNYFTVVLYLIAKLFIDKNFINKL